MVISSDTCPYYCLYNAPSSRPYNHHDNNNNNDNNDDDDDNGITMRIMITLETGLGGGGARDAIYCVLLLTSDPGRIQTKTNK